MIILEKPYISKEIKEYLTESKVKVLKNEFALSEKNEYSLNLLDNEDFKDAYIKGEKLYTTSENALEWIYKNIKDPDLLKVIDITKDKVKFRELIHSIFPEFFFCAARYDELRNMDPLSLKFPLILKPAVGFFSVGVYTVYSENDWEAALKDIDENKGVWGEDYPESVVGNELFILEEYIDGDEFAIDAYFNDNGEAVVLNIMKHDFTGETDVSDRLYYTSAEIINDWLVPFNVFLNQVNSLLGAKNFPAHIEVRVKDGKFCPIEFNPMRFAGWCTTDLTYFAFGFKTYDYYLRNLAPDWSSFLTGKEGKLYSVIVLDKPKGYHKINSFDYDSLIKRFGNVLSLRKLDYNVFPVFGFLFTETEAKDRSELDKIMRSDLTEHIV